jgi:hypothetical protein
MDKAGAPAPAASTMATRKPKAVDGTGSQARALVDLPEHGISAGQLVSADVETIAALVASGRADSHPDAVAYAKTLASLPA